MRERSRRTMLGGGVALVTGVLGAGLFGRRQGHGEPASEPDRVAAGEAVAPASTIELRLYGRSWQVLSDGARATWANPTRGQRSLVFGELLNGPADAAGTKVGELYATCTCVNTPFGAGPLAATLVEQHTLNLEDGTLSAMGTSQNDDGVFAIVGGTGRYAGARGSYTARQAPEGRGGDGTAEIVMTITLDGTA